MPPFSQFELKSRIAICPDHPPRTKALEQEIKIGTGFHNKWYRSQKEHWLGWIVLKEFKAIEAGIDPATLTARQRWSGLNCIPMMFWLAEVVGLENQYLTKAEESARALAKVKSCDCPPHGKGMRESLPWDQIEERLHIMPFAPQDQAEEAGRFAFMHLASIKPKYRKYVDA